jgi:hypothetical protein
VIFPRLATVTLRKQVCLSVLRVRLRRGACFPVRSHGASGILHWLREHTDSELVRATRALAAEATALMAAAASAELSVRLLPEQLHTEPIEDAIHGRAWRLHTGQWIVALVRVADPPTSGAGHTEEATTHGRTRPHTHFPELRRLVCTWV